jgi:anti-sigma-K factor RskA
MTRPDTHSLSGAYALDALTGADQTRFERHLARCQQCALEISELREATARLATAAACEPPAGLTERALAVAARTRQLPAAGLQGRPWLARRPAAPGFGSPAAGSTVRVSRPGPRWRTRLPRLVLAAVAVVGAGLFGAAAAHRSEGQPLPAHTIAAVLTAKDATMLSGRVTTGGTATIVMSHRYRELVFAAAGLRSLPSSEGYELWLMGPDGDTPAGMLPDPRQGMTGPVIASGLTAGDQLALTVEPADGAPHPGAAVVLLITL